MTLRNIVSTVKQKTKHLKKQVKKQVKSREQLSGLITKLIALMLVLVLSPVNVINAYNIPENTEIVPEDEFKSTLHLNVQSTTPVEFNTVSPSEIVVGESEYNRKKREEEEKAKQEEEARQAAESASRTVVTRSVSTTVSADPGLAEKRALAQRAAAAFGIDWKVLEAVWQVETGKSWDTTVGSYAGAQGPMQFMPATWRAYQQDGNGDGVADIYNAEDALYGAANYLAANGAATNVRQALFAYNHADWYVNKVLAVANSI